MWRATAFFDSIAFDELWQRVGSGFGRRNSHSFRNDRSEAYWLAFELVL
jgi:hypothetical protein